MQLASRIGKSCTQPPCAISLVPLIWYIMSTNRSFHLSAPVELSLKSPRVGNPVGGGTAAVASALSWSRKSVRLSICVSICCGNPGRGIMSASRYIVVVHY